MDGPTSCSLTFLYVNLRKMGVGTCLYTLSHRLNNYTGTDLSQNHWQVNKKENPKLLGWGAEVSVYL